MIRVFILFISAITALGLAACGDDATGGCSGGMSDCDGDCVNLQSDRANCGICGTACNPGEVCTEGTCSLSCQAGLTDCNGTCSLSCPAGLTECDGTCVNTDRDPANCGACAAAGGDVCTVDEVCISGGCVATGGCPDPLIDCDGSCVDADTDRAHCGGCAGAGGTVCVAGEICTDGVCTLSCQAGLTDCGGVCVDTTINPNHCGGCAGAGGQVCAADELCHQGGCQSPTGCTGPADCAADELCIGGLCVPKCTSRAECLARDPGGHPYCRDDGMCVAMPESDCLGTPCYVWFVDASSSAPAPDGLSWATAFPTITEANAVVQDGEEVWVANGRYTAAAPGLTVLTMVGGRCSAAASPAPRRRWATGRPCWPPTRPCWTATTTGTIPPTTPTTACT